MAVSGTLSGLFPEIFLIMVSLCDKVWKARKSPLLPKNVETDFLNFQVYSNVMCFNWENMAQNSFDLSSHFINRT